MSDRTDAATCPICGGPNRCGELEPEHRRNGHCWCAAETFPSGIFERVPREKRHKACICKSCLDRYKRGEPTPRSVDRS